MKNIHHFLNRDSMQENNFEKQVQQKMEELRLTPPDEVWQKVAFAIAKRTKDRRILAIFVLLLLFIGSTIFIAIDHTTDKKINNTVSENNVDNRKINSYKNPADSANRQIAVVKSDPKTGIQTIPLDKVKNTRDVEKIPQHTSVPVATTKKEPARVISKKASRLHDATVSARDSGGINNKSAKLSYKTNKKVNVSIENSEPGDAISETDRPADSNKLAIEITNPPVNDVAVSGQLTDTVSKADAGVNTYLNDTLTSTVKTADKKEPSQKDAITQKQQNKWKLGFNFSFGATTTQNGYLGIIGFSNSDALKAFDPAPSNSTGGNVGQGTYSYTPSKIKTGTGITLGAFVQKNISPKTNILLGFNYKAYSSSITIGNKLDSFSTTNFNSTFYRTGSITKYKNYFHFIELPVTIQYKLSKQNKLPVYLSAGVTVSRLISSNALQFDIVSGAYYKDNSLLNKTQVNISLGFLFSLSGSSKNAFLIGPDINYSLNKMADSGFYNDRHYSYFGILMQKTIGKK
ncbi:MAG: outer membrane beta-barrel protein [Ferruginibacter sp.]